jgi:hypothetical protein
VVGEVWIYMLGSIPYLSSPASGSPWGAALRAHTMRRSYPGADKGAQVPPFSQRWTQKWWYGGAEMERPAQPVCTASRRFRNHDHNHLDPRDFRCAAPRQFIIMGMIASGPTTSNVQ